MASDVPPYVLRQNESFDQLIGRDRIDYEHQR